MGKKYEIFINSSPIQIHSFNRSVSGCMQPLFGRKKLTRTLVPRNILRSYVTSTKKTQVDASTGSFAELNRPNAQ